VVTAYGFIKGGSAAPTGGQLAWKQIFVPLIRALFSFCVCFPKMAAKSSEDQLAGIFTRPIGSVQAAGIMGRKSRQPFG
jgi:hypothetical protein